MSEHLLPRSVLDLTCPTGHVISEPQDRRWLWHIEGFLMVNATTARHRELGRTLSRYLYDTCEHHWHDYCGYAGIDEVWQCIWCDLVANEDPGCGHDEDCRR